MSDIECKIIDVINNLRPYLLNDGGNVEFVKFEDGIVYIRMQGACVNCQLMDLTIKDGIESVLKEEIPEIIDVINVE